MRLLTPLLLLPALTAATPHHASNASNASDPLSVRMAHSIISRHQGLYTPSSGSSGPLQAGLVQKVFTRLTLQYPTHGSTRSIQAYITTSADSLLGVYANTSTALSYSLDRLSAGNALIPLLEATGEEKYERAVDVLVQSVHANNRTAQGGLWYYVYPNWSYLDGMYSFAPFYALWTLVNQSDDPGAWDDLSRQFALLAQHCALNDTGLLVHGYDASHTAVWARNPQGRSPHVWGRSLGWYVMGLIDTLEILDAHTCGSQNCAARNKLRGKLVEEFRVRMHAVAIAVDPRTGAWWQVIDQPGREGNYIESSASAMFTYALLKGVRVGYLSHNSTVSSDDINVSNASYVDIARRAYEYMKEAFVVDYGNGTLGWNGTVSVCSLNSSASYEYYVGQPVLVDSVLGSAAFVGASLEVERLGEGM